MLFENKKPFVPQELGGACAHLGDSKYFLCLFFWYIFYINSHLQELKKINKNKGLEYLYNSQNFFFLMIFLLTHSP